MAFPLVKYPEYLAAALDFRINKGNNQFQYMKKPFHVSGNVKGSAGKLSLVEKCIDISNQLIIHVAAFVIRDTVY